MISHSEKWGFLFFTFTSYLIQYKYVEASICEVSISSAPAPNDKFLDLSYQTDWKNKNGWFARHVGRQDYSHIDVSSSCLGTDGLKEVYNAIVRLKDIKLDVRMNQLTTEAATFLFSSLINQGQTKENEIVKNDIDQNNSIDSIGGDDNEKVEKYLNTTENTNATSLQNNDQALKQNSSTVSTISESQSLYVSSLDIGLNDIGSHGEDIENQHTGLLRQQIRQFTISMRNLIESNACPNKIRMDYCGLGPPICRAIGKGIVTKSLNLKKEENDPTSDSFSTQRYLRQIYLSNNDAIGDAGAVALAAALRTAPCLMDAPVLDTLDLSSCGIGDAGAEALALAIRKNPKCLRNLNLSNNHITDIGATSIARALSGNKRHHKELLGEKTLMQSIDLSNNDAISDPTAIEFSNALQCGALHSIFLKNCAIRAEGAAAFSKALCTMASNVNQNSPPKLFVQIDISGNLLGTYELKKKAKGTSLLKGKASATAASYMNFMKKKIQSGLKDTGLDGVIGGFTSSVDSDDDEEELMGIDGNVDPSIKKKTSCCGARSFAESIISHDKCKKPKSDDKVDAYCSISCNFGFRHCFFDKGAADALAAAIVQMRKDFGVELVIDSSMNTEFEEEHIRLLKDADADDESEEMLNEMMERYIKDLEAIQEARQRAAITAKSAAARDRAESELNNFFNARNEGFDDLGRFPSDYDEENLSYDHDGY